MAEMTDCQELCLLETEFACASSAEYEYFKLILDRGSIRSSVRDGLSAPYIHTGDMNWVLPRINLSFLDAGILIVMQEVRLMMSSWWTTPCPSPCCPPKIFGWTSRGHYSETLLLFEFFCGSPHLCLKVRVVVVAYRILLSAPGPIWV